MCYCDHMKYFRHDARTSQIWWQSGCHPFISRSSSLGRWIPFQVTRGVVYKNCFWYLHFFSKYMLSANFCPIFVFCHIFVQGAGFSLFSRVCHFLNFLKKNHFRIFSSVIFWADFGWSFVRMLGGVWPHFCHKICQLFFFFMDYCLSLFPFLSYFCPGFAWLLPDLWTFFVRFFPHLFFFFVIVLSFCCCFFCRIKKKMFC